MNVTVGPYLSVFKARLCVNCVIVCPNNGMVDSEGGCLSPVHRYMRLHRYKRRKRESILTADSGRKLLCYTVWSNPREHAARRTQRSTTQLWLCRKWRCKLVHAWLYGVHRTCVETAAVSRGTSHVTFKQRCQCATSMGIIKARYRMDTVTHLESHATGA